MTAPGKTRMLLKLACWILFACGALVFIVLPGNHYQWIQQMDPSARIPPDPSAGDRSVFAMLLLAAIVLSQLAIMATAITRREKGWAIALALIAIVLWSSTT